MARAKTSKIEVLTPGASGVVLDVNPLDPVVPDDALSNAQNAVPDITAAAMRAWRKRPGQKQFNLSPFAGALLGGIGMPVAGTGGAPSSGGGGSTGSSVGAGNSTGAPGATYTGAGSSGSYATSYGTTGGGSSPTGAAGTGGTAFGVTAPAIMIGLDNNASPDGYGWYLGTTKITAAMTIGLVPQAPGRPANTGFDTGLHGRPFANTADKWMYFQQAIDDASGVSQTANIYRTNGTVTQLVTNIAAYDGSNNKYPVVTAMTFAESTQKLYVAVRDTLYNVTTAPAPQSRVFEIDHTTLTVQQILRISGSTVFCMWWSNAVNKLFYGTCPKYTQTYPNSHAVGTWYPSLGYISGTATGTSQTSGLSTSNPFMRALCEFNGCMFLCSLGDSTGADDYPVAACVVDSSWVSGLRGASPTLYNTGAWSTLGAYTQGANAGAYSAVPFNGALYVSVFNVSGTKQASIVKMVPTNGVGDTTMTSTFSWQDDSTAAQRVPLELFVWDGIMYALGTTGQGGAHRLMWTADGTTWTDVTANLTANNPATGYPIGVFWGID